MRRVKGKVTRAEMSALALAEGAGVRIERVRTLAATPLIVETIVLPARRFPGLTKLGDIPNNVYHYSDHWGITIASAVERLKAVAASKRDAAQLNARRVRRSWRSLASPLTSRRTLSNCAYPAAAQMQRIIAPI